MNIKHPLTREEARDFALTGARRAAALVKPDGRFVYLTVGGQVLPGYNLLRHCGTIWSMAEIARDLGGMDAELQAAERAMRMITETRLRPLKQGLCVSGGKTTKLGGAALAILALVSLDRHGGAGDHLAIAGSLSDFILWMRRSDGDFHHKLSLKTMSIADFRSEYYTGEALFALVRLHQATGRKLLLDVAKDSIGKLRDRQYGVAEQSHWMAYALSALHEVTGDQRLVDYAGQICAAILEQPHYRARQQSTPVSCRTEALMAYADMLVRNGLRTSGPSIEQVMEATAENIGLIIRHRLPDGSVIAGQNDTRIQIDYIQHASSAFLGYFRNHGLTG